MKAIKSVISVAIVAIAVLLSSTPADAQIKFGIKAGANFNSLDETGCYYVQGSSDLPCSNAPTSSGNTAQNCKWLLMIFSHADEGDNIVQLAISQQSDCAIRIRNYSGGSWCAWKTVI